MGKVRRNIPSALVVPRLTCATSLSQWMQQRQRWGGDFGSIGATMGMHMGMKGDATLGGSPQLVSG